jgi:hypothetical protein
LALSGNAYSAEATGFVLTTGSTFTAAAGADNPAGATLNVKPTGAKAIYYKGAAIDANVMKSGKVYTFMYDGTNWQLLGDTSDAGSSYSTMVQTTDTAIGTDTTTDKVVSPKVFSDNVNSVPVLASPPSATAPTNRAWIWVESP